MDIYRVESHELQRNCFKEHDDLISAAKVEDESLKSDPTLTEDLRTADKN